MLSTYPRVEHFQHTFYMSYWSRWFSRSVIKAWNDNSCFKITITIRNELKRNWNTTICLAIYLGFNWKHFKNANEKRSCEKFQEQLKFWHLQLTICAIMRWSFEILWTFSLILTSNLRIFVSKKMFLLVNYWSTYKVGTKTQQNRQP